MKLSAARYFVDFVPAECTYMENEITTWYGELVQALGRGVLLHLRTVNVRDTHKISLPGSLDYQAPFDLDLG